MSPRFVLIDEEGIVIKNHQALDAVNNMNESPTYHFENILDMFLMGNSISFYMPVTRTWERLTTISNVTFENDIYTVSGDAGRKEKSTVLRIPKKEVIHFKEPSIYDNIFGESKIAVALLNIMIDRYGYEHIVTFFLRGGMLTGIIEAQEKQDEKLKRFLSSLRVAFSGRSNAHTDKILPFGAKWVSGGQKFSDIQLRELLKDNAKDLASLIGTYPIVYGETDGVNYANGYTQLELFYDQVIIPKQTIYCRCIQNNEIIRNLIKNPKLRLAIDNSDNKYLSTFNKTVDQVPSLSQILSTNEIRERLGYDVVAGGDEIVGLRQPINPFQYEPESDYSHSAINDENNGTPATEYPEEKGIKGDKKKDWIFENKTVSNLFLNEIDAWVEILASNIGSINKTQFYDILKKRKAVFTGALEQPCVNHAIKYYNEIMFKQVKKAYDKDLENGLKQRAYLFLSGKVRQDQGSSFDGYSETFTQRAFTFIEDLIKDEPDMNRNDLAVLLRQEFGESYKGQANTIINTELGHTVSIVDNRAANDISAYARVATKTWNAKLDRFTRDAHSYLDGETITWEKGKTKQTLGDLTFSNGLRYPRDSFNSTPSEVINCRCVVDYDIIEFDDIL